MVRPSPRLNNDEVKSNREVLKSGTVADEPIRGLHEPPSLSVGYDTFHIDRPPGFDLYDHENGTALGDNINFTDRRGQSPIQDRVSFNAQ